MLMLKFQPKFTLGYPGLIIFISLYPTFGSAGIHQLSLLPGLLVTALMRYPCNGAPNAAAQLQLCIDFANSLVTFVTVTFITFEFKFIG
jgi:hypothetical protein